MSRSTILKRIRRHHASEIIVPLPNEQPSYPKFDSPQDQFKLALEAVGGTFLDGRQEGSIESLLQRVLKETGAGEIYWESASIFDEHRIPRRLRNEKAFEDHMLVFSAHPRQEVSLPLVLHCKRYEKGALETMELSASSALWGIAETGTVLHETAPGTGRLLIILPPAHLVFLSERRLVSSLSEVIGKTGGDPEGRLALLTTGPSQTADIEKRLVRGVHGPGKWYVVLTP